MAKTPLAPCAADRGRFGPILHAREAAMEVYGTWGTRLGTDSPMKTATLAGSWGGAVAMIFAACATAHHSNAMYDEQTTLTLRGTIKSFHWTNPHCWIVLMTSGPNGEKSPDGGEEWNIQLGPPTTLYKEDWKPRNFKPGNTILALIHPTRDGTHKGLWISGSAADGRPLSLENAGR